MHWLIKCRSKPNTDALREATLPAHRNFLDGYRDATWYSGPLFTDDRRSIIVTRGPLLDDHGTKTIGRLLILDVADKAQAEAFWAAEPYNRAGLYEWAMERWRFGHVRPPGGRGSVRPGRRPDEQRAG